MFNRFLRFIASPMRVMRVFIYCMLVLPLICIIWGWCYGENLAMFISIILLPACVIIWRRVECDYKSYKRQNVKHKLDKI